MQKFLGHTFGHLLKLLGKLQQLSSDIGQGHGPLRKGERERLKEFTQQLLECCGAVHLDMSCKHILRTQRALLDGECNHLTVVSMLDTASHLIYDEMEQALFLHVDGAKAAYYQEPWESFGLKFLEVCYPLVEDFSVLSLNIEEAGKCLALARNTAAVFHLMRVMESGLRLLADRARSFGIIVPVPESNPTWDAILKPIEREQQKSAHDKSAEWKKVEPLFADIAAHLRSVKVAWRNPTMHLAASYDDERALDIFNAVRSFMRHLASNLSK